MNENLKQQTNQQIQPQPTQPTQAVKTTAKPTNRLAEVYIKIDGKLTGLMPNKLMRKIFIISVGSFIVIFILLFILGLIVSMGRPKQSPGFILTKPNITGSTPQPTGLMTAVQQQLSQMRTNINSLKFPDSLLTQPLIETKISIEKKR